jgi:hypothetical protein
MNVKTAIAIDIPHSSPLQLLLLAIFALIIHKDETFVICNFAYFNSISFELHDKLYGLVTG